MRKSCPNFTLKQSISREKKQKKKNSRQLLKGEKKDRMLSRRDTHNGNVLPARSSLACCLFSSSSRHRHHLHQQLRLRRVGICSCHFAFFHSLLLLAYLTLLPPNFIPHPPPDPPPPAAFSPPKIQIAGHPHELARDPERERGSFLVDFRG